jgi:hypothetical protein
MQTKELNITPADIHKLADFVGIPWDNDPDFLDLTASLTGKEHLDDLDQDELETVYRHLSGMKRPIQSNLKKRIAAALRNRGYRRIGTGTDAVVWMRDAGAVAKIIISDYGQHRAIESARLLHDLAQKYPDLPNLPRYVAVDGKTIEEFELGGIPFLRVNMEQLEPLQRGTFDEGIIWRFSDYVQRNLTWAQASKALVKEPNDVEFRNKVRRASKLEQNRWHLLYETLRVLYGLGQRYSFSWDLHTENAMRRPRTGELVINDPWA